MNTIEFSNFVVAARKLPFVADARIDVAGRRAVITTTKVATDKLGSTDTICAALFGLLRRMNGLSKQVVGAGEMDWTADGAGIWYISQDVEVAA